MSSYLAAGIASGLEQGTARIDKREQETYRRKQIAEQVAIQNKQLQSNLATQEQNRQSTGLTIERVQQENDMLKESQRMSNYKSAYNDYSTGLNNIYAVGNYSEETMRNRYQSGNKQSKEFYTAFNQYMQETHGFGVGIGSASRTQEEQNDLYEQGRTQPGSIVTKTRDSKHIGGNAMDLTGPNAYEDEEQNRTVALAMREFADKNPQYGAEFLDMDFDPNHVQFTEPDKSNEIANMYNKMIQSNPGMAGITGTAISPVNISEPGQRKQLMEVMVNGGLDVEAFYSMAPAQQSHFLQNFANSGIVMFGGTSVDPTPKVFDMKQSIVTKGKSAAMPQAMKYFDDKLKAYSTAMQAINGKYGANIDKGKQYEYTMLLDMYNQPEATEENKQFLTARMKKLASTDQTPGSVEKTYNFLRSKDMDHEPSMYIATTGVGGAKRLRTVEEIQEPTSTKKVIWDDRGNLTPEGTRIDAELRSNPQRLTKDVQKQAKVLKDTVRAVDLAKELQGMGDKVDSGAFDKLISTLSKVTTFGDLQDKAGKATSGTYEQRALQLAVQIAQADNAGRAPTDADVEIAMDMVKGTWSDQEAVRDARLQELIRVRELEISSISNDMEDLGYYSAVPKASKVKPDPMTNIQKAGAYDPGKAY